MRFRPIDPPRTFEVGHDEKLILRDCGRVHLEPDEQVTFVTPGGAEFDVTRKDWGFYATPSLNGRLPRFGLRGVLVRNRLGQHFVLLVERGCEAAFERYIASERLDVVIWLDDAASMSRLDERMRG